MKEIIIDTETTGLDLKKDRIIEVACIELIDGKRTSRKYHSYFNPRPARVSRTALEVHSISNKFLSDKPLFKDKADQFLDFINAHTLLAHNARFDASMLNQELERAGKPSIPSHRWLDTFKIAKSLFPGKKASLAALCKYFSIKAETSVHSATRDCELLLQVYEAMLEERRRAALALA
ncbi:MAG: exonuclease domain-containing protein [Candidatus Hodgkinia cicadicola]